MTKPRRPKTIVFTVLPNGITFHDYCKAWWLVNEALWESKIQMPGDYITPRSFVKALKSLKWKHD